MQNRYYRSPSGTAASLSLRDRRRSFTSRPEVTVDLVSHGYAQKSVILTIPAPSGGGSSGVFAAGSIVLLLAGMWFARLVLGRDA